MTLDPVAILALIVASAALGLEVRRWFEDRARIELSVMEDMITMPVDDRRPKLSLTAINTGGRPTTITHFVIRGYKSQVHRFFGRTQTHALVLNNEYGQLPKKLNQADMWTSYMVYNSDTQEFRKRNALSVGVICTHKRKPTLFKVNKKSSKKTIDKDGHLQ